MMISFCEIEKEISKSKDGNCENELSLTDITTDTTTNIDDDVDKHPLIDEEFQKVISTYCRTIFR